MSVSERAGLPVWIPEDAPGHCCAVPWNSKGYRRGHEWMANHTVEATLAVERRGGAAGGDRRLARARSGSRREVAPRLSEENRERHGKLEMLDSVAWATTASAGSEGQRQARLRGAPPDLLDRHLGWSASFEASGRPRSRARSEIPVSATCCGMAGDRGLLHPELTRVGDGRARRPSSPGAATTPTSAATAPARSRLEQGTGPRLRVPARLAGASLLGVRAPGARRCGAGAAEEVALRIVDAEALRASSVSLSSTNSATVWILRPLQTSTSDFTISWSIGARASSLTNSPSILRWVNGRCFR